MINSNDINKALRVIGNNIHRTPISTSSFLSEKYNSNMYQIFVITMTDFDTKYFGWQKIGGFWSHALAYDLGSLRHLKEYGIDIYK